MLGDRNARLFLGVSLSSGFGNTAMSLAAPVWVLALTGSASLAALCGLCVYLPTLAGPVLGTLVDRLPRQRLLVATALVMAALLPVLLLVDGPGRAWLIFAVMSAYGVSYVLLDAGEAALLPAAVPVARLGGLNSLRMSVQEGVKLVAPPAGAALFAWWGGAPVALLAAFTLAVAALCYAAIRPGPVPPPAREPGSLLARTRTGLRFLGQDGPLRRLALAGAAAVGLSGLGNAASYVVVVGDLGRPPEFAGALTGAQGAGSLVGGLLCARLLDRHGEAALARWGAALSALGTLLLCVPVLPAVAAGRVLVGVGLPWTVIAMMTAVQRRTPATLIGRVSAAATTAVFGPTAGAIAIGAGAIELVDHRAVLAAVAVGTALGAFPLLRDHGRAAARGRRAGGRGPAWWPAQASRGRRRARNSSERASLSRSAATISPRASCPNDCQNPSSAAPRNSPSRSSSGTGSA